MPTGIQVLGMLSTVYGKHENLHDLEFPSDSAYQMHPEWYLIQ